MPKKAVKEPLVVVLLPLALWNESQDKESNQKGMNRRGFVLFFFFFAKFIGSSETSAKSLIPVILN